MWFNESSADYITIIGKTLNSSIIYDTDMQIFATFDD